MSKIFPFIHIIDPLLKYTPEQLRSYIGNDPKDNIENDVYEVVRRVANLIEFADWIYNEEKRHG